MDHFPENSSVSETTLFGCWYFPKGPHVTLSVSACKLLFLRLTAGFFSFRLHGLRRVYLRQYESEDCCQNQVFHRGRLDIFMVRCATLTDTQMEANEATLTLRLALRCVSGAKSEVRGPRTEPCGTPEKFHLTAKTNGLLMNH